MTARQQTLVLLAAGIAGMAAILIDSHWRLFLGIALGTLLLGLIVDVIGSRHEEESGDYRRSGRGVGRRHRHSGDAEVIQPTTAHNNVPRR